MLHNVKKTQEHQWWNAQDFLEAVSYQKINRKAEKHDPMAEKHLEADKHDLKAVEHQLFRQADTSQPHTNIL